MGNRSQKLLTFVLIVVAAVVIIVVAAAVAAVAVVVLPIVNHYNIVPGYREGSNNSGAEENGGKQTLCIIPGTRYAVPAP